MQLKWVLDSKFHNGYGSFCGGPTSDVYPLKWAGLIDSIFVSTYVIGQVGKQNPFVFSALSSFFLVSFDCVIGNGE